MNPRCPKCGSDQIIYESNVAWQYECYSCSYKWATNTIQDARIPRNGPFPFRCPWCEKGLLKEIDMAKKKAWECENCLKIFYPEDKKNAFNPSSR